MNLGLYCLPYITVEQTFSFLKHRQRDGLSQEILPNVELSIDFIERRHGYCLKVPAFKHSLPFLRTLWGQGCIGHCQPTYF